jgi:cellulose synthase/poly-beta-1,6-N-acetylglucosamine synthase-like glycosyltransferase
MEQEQIDRDSEIRTHPDRSPSWYLEDSDAPANETAETENTIPESAVTSFDIDQRFARLSLAIFCFGLAVVTLVAPIPLIGGSWITSLTAAPLVATLFFAWYLGRPLTAVYNHLSQDYAPVEDLPSMTVSMPAYNEAGTISDCINGIMDQKYPAPLQVVVCDDGSTDDTWETLEFLSVVYDELTIVHQENSGSSVARNRALEEAKHEIVLSMDADTVLKDNALYEAGASFARNPDAVAVGTNVGVLNPKESIWTRMQVFNYLLSMEMSRMFQSQFGFVLCLSGGCSVFKRDVLEAVGGWNDSRLLSDDYDLTVRVHEHGPIEYCPTIHAYTEVPSSVRSLWHQRMAWRQRGVTVTLVHLRKSGDRSYGTLGMIGLPMRMSLIALVFVVLLQSAFAVISGPATVPGMASQLLISGIIITTGLMALGIGITIVVCRDRKVLQESLGLLLYLFVYRWFVITVRFLGSLKGLYYYYLYWREPTN